MTWTLHQGDCLDVLPTLADGSVDAVVTDPPYAQTNEKYDDDIACRPDVWRECFRVCKPDAALVAFAGSPTYHRIATAIEAGGWKVRQMWAWVYRDGMITSAWPKEGFDRLAPAMDPIVYATKGKVLLTLEREGEAWEAWHAKKPTDAGYSDRARPMSGVNKADGHWPRNVASDGVEPFEYFALPRTSGKYRAERVGHPNQKPLALMQWLCGKLPRGVVLDPFAGSGTLLAALDAGHTSAVGVEKNPAYCDIIRERMTGGVSPEPATETGGAVPQPIRPPRGRPRFF